MPRMFRTPFCFSILLLAGSSFAAPKTHTVALGRWRAVEVPVRTPAKRSRSKFAS